MGVGHESNRGNEARDSHSLERSSENIEREINLCETSFPLSDQGEPRAVAGEDIGKYLNLAMEQRWKRTEAASAAKGDRLSAETAEKIAEYCATCENQKVDKLRPEVIKELLRDFDIDIRDWQKVTAAADVVKQLQAAKGQKALEVGLSSDASSEELVNEREWRENVANLDLVGKVLERLQQLREDPQGSTSALRKDGSVGLGRYTLMAPAALENERFWWMEEPSEMYIWFNSSRFALGGALIGALALGLACRHIWEGIVIGALLGVACALPILFIGAVFFGVAFPTVLENYSERIIQKILDKMPEDPHLKPILDELRDMGIECKFGIDRGPYLRPHKKLVITPYIPSKKA